jgi:hypothetical protein
VKLRVLPLLASVATSAAVLAGGCATRPAEVEPRYVAVHNAFAAMGMSSVGPIHRGSLAEGREARFEVVLPALPSGCATVAAFGAAGVRDLDVELLDPDDKSLGHDVTNDSEAVVKACPARAGRFTIVVRMAHGAGEFLAASWVGAGGEAASASASGAVASTAPGTCEAPLPLAAGSFMGNTRRGEAEQTGGCGNSEAKELVYKLDVPRRQRVVVEVEPNNFDSVLYVRKDDCGEKDAEVACNDDATTGTKRNTSSRGSRIDEVFDAGTYWVIVDGYNNESGAFRMNVQVADVPSLAEACGQARPVLLGQQTTGTLTGAFNHAAGTCDRGRGPDAIHRLDVSQRARVRVVMHSDELSPVLHVRQTCTDEQTELACTDAGIKPEEAAFAAVLDRGRYTVFADSGDKAAHGSYALDVDLAPEQGTGVPGDSCGDALTVGLEDPPVSGDTFAARDDFSGRCTAPGAPDTVYRFDLARRSRVTARFGHEEGDHVFVLLRSCTDRSEIACGPVVDEVLPPGSYWLVVDGTTKGPLGRYSLHLRAKDVTLQDNACRMAPALALGQTVTGTTAGGGDRFTESCAGREDSQASGDRVYKLSVASRTHVELRLSTPNHDGVLAIRRTCVDPPQMKSAKVAEVACNNDGPDTRHSKLDVTLDAGTYYVVVDGHQGKHEGAFTLEAKAVK